MRRRSFFERLSASAAAVAGVGVPSQFRAQSSVQNAPASATTTDLVAKLAGPRGSFGISQSTVAVSSLGELAAVPVNKGQHASLGGYWPDAGYGGGVFEFRPEIPKNRHNGGTVISPTVPWDEKRENHQAFLKGVGETDPQGKGVWVRRLDSSRRINIQWFGVFPDFDTDKEVGTNWLYAINLAIANTPASGVLYIPASDTDFVYGHDGEIQYKTYGITIEGDGYGTWGKKSGGSTFYNMNRSGANAIRLGVSRPKLRWLKFVGNSKSGDGLYCDLENKIFMEGVISSYHGKAGCHIRSPQSCVWIDCEFSRNKGGGWLVDGKGFNDNIFIGVQVNRNTGFGFKSTSHSISNSFFKCNFTKHDAAPEDTAFLVVGPVSATKLETCWFENNSTSIGIDTKAGSVDLISDNCRFAEIPAKGYGVRIIAGSGYTSTNDQFRAVAGTCIEVEEGSSNCAFLTPSFSGVTGKTFVDRARPASRHTFKQSHSTMLVSSFRASHVDIQKSSLAFRLGSSQTKGVSLPSNRNLKFHGIALRREGGKPATQGALKGYIYVGSPQVNTSSTVVATLEPNSDSVSHMAIMAVDLLGGELKNAQGDYWGVRLESISHYDGEGEFTADVYYSVN